MAGIVVLDAGVLIGLLDSGDRHHVWAMRIFKETLSYELSMSVLTYAEVMVHPQKAGKAAEFQQRIAGLHLNLRGFGTEDAMAVAELRALTSLKMPDVLVLHAAQSQGAALATTDNALADQARAHGLSVLHSGD
ncbi:MAG: PIN domain-containing protein [Pontimonas sp.]